MAAVEYSLLAVLIGVSCIALFIMLGSNLAALFGSNDSGLAGTLASVNKAAGG
jgi:Flp pilus assembly pilin Flp